MSSARSCKPRIAGTFHKPRERYGAPPRVRPSEPAEDHYYRRGCSELLQSLSPQAVHVPDQGA